MINWFFKPEGGTRQGDPLSAYLFILVFEIVFFRIRKSDTVKGFKVEWSEIKLTAFVDDSTFFLRDVESLKSSSHLKINDDKCEACWIGKAKYRKEYPVECTWRSLVSDPIKILGAYFGYDDSWKFLATYFLVRKKKIFRYVTTNSDNP